MKKRLIKASEINTFIFCHRAWWFQKIGTQPNNSARLEAGNEGHRDHYGIVARSDRMRRTGIIFLLLSVVLVVMLLTGGVL